MLSHMWSEESARGVSNAVFWGQNRLNQLCSGVHLQIHHTHFSLSLPLCSPWHLRLMQSSSYYVNAVAMAPRSCLQPTNTSPLMSSLICGSLI